MHYTPFMLSTDCAVDVDTDKPCFTLVLLHISGLHRELRGQINGLMSTVYEIPFFLRPHNKLTFMFRI